MSNLPRREFLRRSAEVLCAASALSSLPETIRRALAIPAMVQTDTLKDVKHVVILMQENRSASSHCYDFTASSTDFSRRFAGRRETGKDGISDPAIATLL
jgi:phospholipase C